MSEYRLRKEEFVTKGNDGSSIGCIVSIISTTVVGIGLWQIIGHILVSKGFLNSLKEVRRDNFNYGILKWFLFDFFILILPLLFFMNNYDNLSFWFNLISLVLITYYKMFYISDQKSGAPKEANDKDNKSQNFHYITVYRSLLMLLTCIAILSVDFYTFPRYLAKVEEYGASLMDVGVGSFVFSSGIIAGRTKAHSNSRKLSLLYKALYHSIPLWILGIIRFISVKGIDYQEHVSEYGVHWNFFFTLGCLPIPVLIIEMILMNFLHSGWIVIFIYQLTLSFTWLEKYIILEPRNTDDLFSMNREGICSLWGYIAIYLVAKNTGYAFFSKDSKESKFLLLVSSFIPSSLFFISYYAFGLDISRRLCNLPYVSWVCTMNILLVISFKALEKILLIVESPLVLQAVNYNSLFIFLVANLLTGFVNMMVPTLDVRANVAYFILICYIGTVAIISLALFIKQIKVIRF